MKRIWIDMAKRLGVPMLGLLVASVLLGFAYNMANPLGVRAPRPAEKTSSPTIASAPTAHPAPATVKPTRSNEVIAAAPQVLQSPTSTNRPSTTNEPVALAPSVSASSVLTNLSIPTVTWAQVKPLLTVGRMVLVDARFTNYFQAGHIPSAVCLPPNHSASDIEAFTNQYSKDTPIITYCGSASCPLAHDLARMLKTVHGYTDVSVMPGGYAEYRAAEAKVQVRSAP